MIELREDETLKLRQRWLNHVLEDVVQRLRELEFRRWQGGFRVTFVKGSYTTGRLRAMGSNARQIRIVTIVRGVQGVSLGEMHRLLPDVSAKTIQRDLKNLVEKGLVKARGEKKGRHYGLLH